jgi:hypothetical protein
MLIWWGTLAITTAQTAANRRDMSLILAMQSESASLSAQGVGPPGAVKLLK